jgi:hypothetical protein
MDERDQEIYAARVAAFDSHDGPRVGDYVDFPDGVSRLISYVWRDDDGWDGGAVQTSDGGSFYLGAGYMSFSGSLYRCVPSASLTLTDETREMSAWFFRHDWRTAHNAVDVKVTTRVWKCNVKAPSC